MPPERVIFRYRRMIEIVSRIAAHAKPFHEGARTLIGRGCVRNDFGQRERAKAVVKRQSGRLRCITASPVRGGEPPPDFHAGRERRGKTFDRQSGEPDEGSDTGHLDSPQTKAVLVEMMLYAIDHRVAIGLTEGTRE